MNVLAGRLQEQHGHRSGYLEPVCDWVGEQAYLAAEIVDQDSFIESYQVWLGPVARLPAFFL